MKNKYERLFDEVYKQTKDNSINWKLIARNSNSDVIFNPNLVLRQFESELKINNSRYKVLFIEKKAPNPEYDYLESFYPEILIIEESEVVANLNNSIIEQDSLIRLMNLIESRSDKAKKLFDNF